MGITTIFAYLSVVPDDLEEEELDDEKQDDDRDERGWMGSNQRRFAGRNGNAPSSHRYCIFSFPHPPPSRLLSLPPSIHLGRWYLSIQRGCNGVSNIFALGMEWCKTRQQTERRGEDRVHSTHSSIYTQLSFFFPRPRPCYRDVAFLFCSLRAWIWFNYPLIGILLKFAFKETEEHVWIVFCCCCR